MVQALMKAFAFVASLLAVCGLTLSASAQEAMQPMPAAAELAASAEPTFSTSLPEVSFVAHAPLVVPPEQPGQHRFFDRQQQFALLAHSGMRVADTIKTCRVLSHGGERRLDPHAIVRWNRRLAGRLSRRRARSRMALPQDGTSSPGTDHSLGGNNPLVRRHDQERLQYPLR